MKIQRRRLAWSGSAIGFALAVGLLAPTASLARPGDPTCAPDVAYTVKLETQEAELKRPLVATHEAEVLAEVSGDSRRSRSRSPRVCGSCLRTRAARTSSCPLHRRSL
jgi:hypothetical protein